MRIGLNVNYSANTLDVPMDLIQRAESAGFDSAWIPEAYGSDAVSIASWILARTERIRVGTAIMQIPARTPACTAMTAMGLAQLSGGRFILGLGMSGPQVVEGWHGMPHSKPLSRTREYITIVRRIMARRAPVEYEGDFYQLPFRGEGSTGLGKPLKSLLSETSVPIYMASFTPAGLACAAEVADGVLPIWCNPERADMFEPHLQKGFDRVPDKDTASFDLAPGVPVVIGDDLDACRAPIRRQLALYVGGMGARKKNFYNDYAKRLGYEAEAVKIQDLYLSGQRDAAEAAVPDSLIDDFSLIGSPERIADHAERWREACRRGQFGSLIFGIRQPEAVDLLAELFL